MDRKTSRNGLLYGIACYLLWGLIPLYFKPLTNAHVTPPEVLAHRVFWSFLLFAAVVTLSRRWREFGRALRSRTTALTLIATTLLIGINWLTFLYAVSWGQVLQSSLAYFATPLLSVLFGVVFLKERLRPYQILAIVIAAIGVVSLAILGGQMPWIAIVLAVSFALYGLLRKTVAVDGVLGLLFETMVLAPAGLAYILYLHSIGRAMFLQDPTTDWLLIFSGAATGAPLLLFAIAARRLQLSTLGILQYLAPSMQFFLGVAVFREPFSGPQLICFGFIWVAVAIYCADSWRHFKRSRAMATGPADESRAKQPTAGVELDV